MADENYGWNGNGSGWNGNASGNVLFTNVRVLDATGEYPYTGEVLVQGNRIKQITARLLALRLDLDVVERRHRDRRHGRDADAGHDRRASPSLLEQCAGHRSRSR